MTLAFQLLLRNQVSNPNTEHSQQGSITEKHIKNEASSRFPSQHRLAPTISIFLYRFLCQLFTQRKTSKKFLVQHRNDTPGSMLLRIQLPSSLTSHHHGSGAMWPKTGEKAIALFRHGAKPGVYWILSRPSSHPGSFKCISLQLLWNRFGFIGCYNWWLSTRPKDSTFLCLTRFWTG